MTEKFNIVSCSIKTFKFIETGGFMSLLFHLISIYFSGIFRFYFVSLNQNRMCYPRISAFLAEGRFCVCMFAGRRCMSVMLFDRTTNKLCLCLSATRRYFASRTKIVFYSLYIQGEMQMETINENAM